MNKQTFDINNLRVAAPCSVGWETMSGDERIRRCHSCKMNIYNISEMTRSEVENLIVNREDRICIRLYKRADGTVLTKDCPVGLRAYQKRISRFAGATLAALLGLFSISYGQKTAEKEVDISKIKVVKTANEKSVLTGITRDQDGAIIPEVKLKLYKAGVKKPLKLKSDKDGKYAFINISSGIYRLEAEFTGFMKLTIINLEVKNNEKQTADIELQIGNPNLKVGIYTQEPLIDPTSSSITTKITRKQIEKLPY